MVQIAGKYQVVENKNFYELLLKMGVPEENAKKANEELVTLLVEVDGNKIRLTIDATNVRNELVLNEEVDEMLPGGATVKSTATLDGSVLTIKSKDDNNGLTRVYTFSNVGIELKIITKKGEEATRIYRRI